MTSKIQYLAQWDGKKFRYYVLNPTCYKGKPMPNVLSIAFLVSEEEVYEGITA
jgi:hypothetical protein